MGPSEHRGHHWIEREEPQVTLLDHGGQHVGAAGDVGQVAVGDLVEGGERDLLEQVDAAPLGQVDVLAYLEVVDGVRRGGLLPGSWRREA